jgi:hypothetical protein
VSYCCVSLRSLVRVVCLYVLSSVLCSIVVCLYGLSSVLCPIVVCRYVLSSVLNGTKNVKTHNRTTQKTKKMSNTDPNNTPRMNAGVREG